MQKRKRRDYRLARRAQFTRPEPGFSLYEGRTRGKRPRYTFSDDEGGDSDAISARRSTRQSGISTPAEPNVPTFTASGRQVKSRHGGAYGESILSGQADGTERAKSSGMDAADEEDGEPVSRGRPPRMAPRVKSRPGRHIDGYNELDEMDDESEAPSSGNEWDSGIEDEPDDEAEDDEDDDAEMSDDDDIIAREEESEDEDDRRSRSLVVSLRYSKTGSSPIPMEAANGTPASKQGEATTASTEHQIDLTSAILDTSSAGIPPIITDEHPTPKNESPRHLHLTYLPPTLLPTTRLSPISAIPPAISLQKASIEPSGAQIPPPTPAQTFGNAHANMLPQKPVPPKSEELPNFQQYAYQPSPE